MRTMKCGMTMRCLTRTRMKRSLKLRNSKRRTGRMFREVMRQVSARREAMGRTCRRTCCNPLGWIPRTYQRTTWARKGSGGSLISQRCFIRSFMSRKIIWTFLIIWVQQQSHLNALGDFSVRYVGIIVSINVRGVDWGIAACDVETLIRKRDVSSLQSEKYIINLRR